MGQVILRQSNAMHLECFDLPSVWGLKSMRMSRRSIPIIALIAAFLLPTAWLGTLFQEHIARASIGSALLFEPEAYPAIAGDALLPDRPQLAPLTARRLNAAIPFAVDEGPAAQSFHFGEVTADRDWDRAVDCLAIAAMAEAGGGDQGQRAVMQVVLNRVRHPSFPRTICGVVFEGSHRSTGCQFTFTCDGALQRRYSAAAWSRARARAVEALDGQVYSPVSLATHYHTDWVHPYWSASLIKLAQVDTHLFFGWPGYIGRPAAFHVAYRGGEPAIPALAYLPSHSGNPSDPASNPLASERLEGSDLINVVVRNQDGGAFVLLTGNPSAESAEEMARGICANRPSCKVMGWFELASIPTSYPVPPNLRARIGFSYFRSLDNDETTLYDCARFKTVTSPKCLPRTYMTRSNI